MRDDIFEADQLRWMAMAYFDSGLYLAEAIVEEDISSSYHGNFVPIFLIHQSLELIFKSALKLKAGKFPRSHDLGRLHSEFCRFYPDLRFEIPDALMAPRKMNHELFLDISLPHVCQHERLRYPTDKMGRRWEFAEEIDIDAALSDIQALEKHMLAIWNTLNDIIDRA